MDELRANTARRYVTDVKLLCGAAFDNRVTKIANYPQKTNGHDKSQIEYRKSVRKATQNDVLQLTPHNSSAPSTLTSTNDVKQDNILKQTCF